jgi:hypothetical protein
MNHLSATEAAQRRPMAVTMTMTTPPLTRGCPARRGGTPVMGRGMVTLRRPCARAAHGTARMELPVLIATVLWTAVRRSPSRNLLTDFVYLLFGNKAGDNRHAAAATSAAASGSDPPRSWHALSVRCDALGTLLLPAASPPPPPHERMNERPDGLTSVIQLP